MRRRAVLRVGVASAVMGAAGLACPAIAQAEARTLHFVPQANLANPDPIWTTATVAINHGYMVFDTLYGIDDAVQSQPQMCAGHEVSYDKLTWTFTLRDGLLFHDNEKVRADRLHHLDQSLGDEGPVRPAACVAHRGDEAARRQAVQHPPEEAVPPDALRARRAQLLHDAGAHGEDPVIGADQGICRLAARSLPEERMGVRRARRLGEVREICAAPGAALVFLGRQGGEFDRVEWIVQPDPATAAAALQTGEVDWVELPLIDLLPMLKQSPTAFEVKVFDPFGWIGVLAINHLYPPFDNREAAARAAAGGGPAGLRAVDRGGAVGSWPLSGRVLHRRLPDGQQGWARSAVRPARHGIGEEARCGIRLQGRTGPADVAD